MPKNRWNERDQYEINRKSRSFDRGYDDAYGQRYDDRPAPDYGVFSNRDEFSSFGSRTGRLYGNDVGGSAQFGYEGTFGGTYGTIADKGFEFGSDLDTPHDPSRSRSFAGLGPKGWSRSDERIMEDVCEALTHAPHVNASEMEVDVKDGIVTLRGAVDERRTKKTAEALIERINGVKDVRNELTIDESLFQKMKNALRGE